MRKHRGLRIGGLLLLLAALAALPRPAGAQTITTVTGTVTDPSGTPYAGATLQISITASATPSLTPCTTAPSCPVMMPPAITLDATGSFTQNLPANGSITPGSSTYNFTVSCGPGCAIAPPLGAGPQSFTVTTVTISGASQSVSATLSGAAPLLIGFGPIGGKRYVATSDFTDASSTSFQAITGLSWLLPANQASRTPFACHLAYSQATGAVSDSFGIQASAAPTNIFATGVFYTSASAFTAGNLPTLSTTTATAIVTATPSATGTIFNVDLYGWIENPTGNANTIAIQVSQSTAGDLITVKRGSFCVTQ